MMTWADALNEAYAAWEKHGEEGSDPPGWATGYACARLGIPHAMWRESERQPGGGRGWEAGTLAREADLARAEPDVGAAEPGTCTCLDDPNGALCAVCLQSGQPAPERVGFRVDLPETWAGQPAPPAPEASE